MSNHSIVIYQYDGTVEGFLCCVHESFIRKEFPDQILTDNEQQNLLTTHGIPTHLKKAKWMRLWIRQQISKQAEEWMELGFLSCMENKEKIILEFLWKGRKYGADICRHLADPTVSLLFKGIKHLKNEAHLLTGFLRFSDYDGILVGVISPKNNVLPILRYHFCDRFPNEQFLIYDAMHGIALIHRPGKFFILPVEEFLLQPPTAEERQYQRLWKKYYDTIAIQERYNPKVRMSHMPKRYWTHMTEFQWNPDRDLSSQ